VDEISEETQRTYERLLRKHRKALLAYPNVHAVDVGFEFADGEPTGQLALRVHVTDKVPASELRRADRVPEEIDGVPVDVIHYNPTPQLARNVRHNPVIGGIQIMNTSTPGGGTLGMIVLSRRSLRPLAISNHHVMCRTPEVAADIVSQPGTARPADLLGPVFASDRALDCAVCSLGSRPWSFDIYGIGGPTGTAEARIGMKVMKSGLSSGVTWGRIDGISSAGFTVVPDTAVPAAGEMSLPGDSGSIWMDYTNRAIGLHFAGEGPTDPSERASVKHIHPVLNKLDVLVFTGVAIGEAWIGGGGHVLARTRPGAPCFLSVYYPSGRRSTAKGLGAKTAGPDGWVEWRWRIGTHTSRRGAGTGRPLGIPLVAIAVVDGVEHRLERPLEGTTHTT